MSRSVLGALIVWLAVVVAGSTMTWATINTAGQEVLSPVAVPTTSTVEPSPTNSESSTPRPSRKPSSKPRVTLTPRTRSPSATPRTPEPTRSQPRSEPTSEPPSPSRSPLPAPQPPTRPSPTGEAPRSSTWQGIAGSVTVLCSASSISLQAASPSTGYAVEVRERGPEEVEVRLESDDEETRVEAFCSSGQARFNVES